MSHLLYNIIYFHFYIINILLLFTIHSLFFRINRYQWDGIKWLLQSFLRHRHCLLADQSGLGKRIQVFGLLHILEQIKYNFHSDWSNKNNNNNNTSQQYNLNQKNNFVSDTDTQHLKNNILILNGSYLIITSSAAKVEYIATLIQQWTDLSPTKYCGSSDDKNNCHLCEFR